MSVVVESVTKTFPQNGGRIEVLRDASLTIQDGEFASLLGPSGCGKSTLVMLIAGLDRPDTGRVLVHGTPVTGPGVDRVVVFQDAALFPWLTVLDNVTFGLRMAGVAKPEREARAMEFIKLVHLSKFARAYPYQLSGGMKQRVAIARALALEPQILLMDEPFGALDAQTRGILQQELTEIWLKTHKTILFVTHNVREATGLADRIFEIAARPGRIKRTYTVEVPRPRLNNDPRLLALQQRILQSLSDEVAKVAEEEYGEALSVEEARRFPPVDRNLGMHI